MVFKEIYKNLVLFGSPSKVFFRLNKNCLCEWLSADLSNFSFFTFYCFYRGVDGCLHQTKFVKFSSSFQPFPLAVLRLFLSCSLTVLVLSSPNPRSPVCCNDLVANQITAVWNQVNWLDSDQVLITPFATKYQSIILLDLCKIRRMRWSRFL